MSIEIDLNVENRCPMCYGSGKLYDSGKEAVCHFCEGFGYVVTTLGRDIINMLRRRALID